MLRERSVVEVAGELWALLKEIDPPWVTAGAAAAGVLVALVTAITGLRSLRQLRADSRERSRPMMAAELRKPPYVLGTQLLVIRNYGPSIARNVKVIFDPPTLPITNPTPEQAAQGMSPFMTRRYAEPIPVVTPGMELINVWFNARAKGGGWVNFDPTPDRFTVTIAYNGPDGKARYKDLFPLDVALLRAHTFAASSAAPENQLKGMGESLTKIEKSLAHIARTTESREISRPAATADAEHPD